AVRSKLYTVNSPSIWLEMPEGVTETMVRPSQVTASCANAPCAPRAKVKASAVAVRSLEVIIVFSCLVVRKTSPAGHLRGMLLHNDPLALLGDECKTEAVRHVERLPVRRLHLEPIAPGNGGRIVVDPDDRIEETDPALGEVRELLIEIRRDLLRADERLPPSGPPEYGVGVVEFEHGFRRGRRTIGLRPRLQNRRDALFAILPHGRRRATQQRSEEESGGPRVSGNGVHCSALASAIDPLGMMVSENIVPSILALVRLAARSRDRVKS